MASVPFDVWIIGTRADETLTPFSAVKSRGGFGTILYYIECIAPC